jgi:hypothetical protein
LGLFFRIKNVEYPGGFDNLCVAGDGSADCVSLGQKNFLLLKYGVTEYTVSR